jgi:hypothetical protein
MYVGRAGNKEDRYCHASHLRVLNYRNVYLAGHGVDAAGEQVGWLLESRVEPQNMANVVIGLMQQ